MVPEIIVFNVAMFLIKCAWHAGPPSPPDAVSLFEVFSSAASRSAGTQGFYYSGCCK